MPAPSPELHASGPPLPPSLRLLLVEDSQFDVDLVVLALEQGAVSFAYDVATNSAECQQLLEQQRYDAVLSDFRLLGFTAHDTLRLLHDSNQEIPLILVTGNLEDEAAVECIKAGMTDYVMKDRLFRLPMVLQRSLDEFALRRQQRQVTLQLQRQFKREAMINRILQSMRESLKIDDVMQTTADMLHEALQVDRCLICSLQPDYIMLVRHVSSLTVGAERLQHQQTYCPFLVHYGDRFYNGQPVIHVQSTEHLPADCYDYMRSLNIQAIAVFPLMHQGTLLGAIALHQCDHARDWDADDISLVEAIANQTAIAIHQAQLYEHAQQQAQHERLLNRISQSLNSSLDPDFILEEIVTLTGEVFQVDRVVLFKLDGAYIQATQEWKREATLPSIGREVIPTTDWFDAHPIADITPEWTFYVEDYITLPQNPSRQILTSQYGVRSVLCVPIFIRDCFWGGIDLCTTQGVRTFRPSEISLLQQIANRTAIALANAQSYEHLEQLVQARTQELEREKYLSDAANRAKSEFLAHMSHELRTPLTGILGFAHVLSDHVGDPSNEPQHQQYIESIIACGQHLLELINDLLDLSKIEAGREELFLESVVIQEICDACMNMVQENARSKNLALRVEIEPGLTLCTADKRRLKQILSNLLSNAVKFTQRGSVQLTVYAQADQLYFAVQDTGIGISKTDQERLFQTFTQLDGGLSRQYEGTGLGLVLAQRLAHLHGGDITVTSDVGQGSCFTLRLPLTQVPHLRAIDAR
ncbi:MAG: GAF domain-containing protein [Kaiparowitsia implicata GSE-PSE-MK54-09C]|jgi:signal transduction histidine kinase/DNA-binding response OmpR family regulator|nr:GAF domain-containing protein [Kaiparowitsia implicata GSE-PSE-MK54-09C]